MELDTTEPSGRPDMYQLLYTQYGLGTMNNDKFSKTRLVIRVT